MIKKALASILFVVLISIFGVASRRPAVLSSRALQQEQPALTISLRKDFGYNNFTNTQIQGTFTIRAKGPENLAKVAFVIDGQPIGEATAAPFNLRFDTGQFGLGKHVIHAVGTTTDGTELQSNTLTVEFVTPSQSMSSVGSILLPILGVIVLAALVAFVIPAIFTRGKKVSLAAGAPRSYSPLGGTICPKCERPFGMHMYGLNLGIGKLDRCPYCGKWSVVRRASPAQLQAAEAAELEAGKEIEAPSEASEEEKLRKELDNSRYQDL